MVIYIAGINSVRFLLINTFFCDAGDNSVLLESRF